MADTLPTVWPAEAHTLAKHAILKRYLDAWLPILTQNFASGRPGNREVLYIDAFAGPGEYAEGEPGSPVIAMKAALDHARPFPTPVRMVFVEQRPDRFNHLNSILAPYIQKSAKSSNVRVHPPLHGECDAVLNSMLDTYEKQGTAFGPALAFFDQFGYGAVPMTLIGRILRYGSCEVFTYLEYKSMNRWITDPTKASTFSRAYGGDEWRECINLPEEKGEAGCLSFTRLHCRENRGHAKYVTPFLMYDKNDQPLYWLIFCTNNLRGLEEMKKAMWSVDQKGNFRFSDKDNPDQLTLLDESYNQGWLADELDVRLKSREMTAGAVKEFVLTETPCYLFKEALKALETDKSERLQITKSLPGRRRGEFRDVDLDKIVVKFGSTSLF